MILDDPVTKAFLAYIVLFFLKQHNGNHALDENL